MLHEVAKVETPKIQRMLALFILAHSGPRTLTLIQNETLRLIFETFSKIINNYIENTIFSRRIIPIGVFIMKIFRDIRQYE